MTSTDTFTDAEIDAELSTPPEAPFGYKADGTPKRGPGGRPSSKRARTRSAGSRPGGAPAPAPRASATPKRKATKGTDYRQSLRGLVAIPCMVVSFVSPLDAVALQVHSEPLIEAINETAQDRAEVAALCERLLAVGPYGAILAAALPLVGQILENHQVLPTPVTRMLGAKPRDVLMAEAQAIAAEQEAELAAAQEAMAAAQAAA